MVDQAKVAELVERAQQKWAEHHRLRVQLNASADATQRLMAQCNAAMDAARWAEGELSSLLQRAALEEVRVVHPEAVLPPIEHPETTRPELTQELEGAFRRGQDGFRPSGGT